MLEYTKTQKAIIEDDSRFKVITAGRRWGKTYLSLYDLLLDNDKGAWKHANMVNWFVAPTYRQAKNIAWNILKKICYYRPEYIKSVNESDLHIEFTNGSIISLKGADKEDSLRGVGLDKVNPDEFAFMKKAAWTEVIRPALSDKLGKAMFIGTPDGFNYFYDLYQQGRNQENGYKSWHFKSIDSPFIDAEEIENARRELDERTFRQEYEATFETATGRVYYTFDRDKNNTDRVYDKSLPLKVYVDFNVSPCIWTLGQTIKDEDFVIDEICRQNTNTQEMAKVVGDLYGYDSYFNFYGDYSGTYRSTKSYSTDYDIIRTVLSNSDYNLKPAPIVVDRVNATNSRLCTASGDRKLFINVKKCPELTKDYEQVVWKEGKREIDKSNIERTHASDGIGYYIDYEYGLKQGRTRSKQW